MDKKMYGYLEIVGEDGTKATTDLVELKYLRSVILKKLHYKELEELEKYDFTVDNMVEKVFDGDSSLGKIFNTTNFYSIKTVFSNNGLDMFEVTKTLLYINGYYNGEMNNKVYGKIICMDKYLYDCGFYEVTINIVDESNNILFKIDNLKDFIKITLGKSEKYFIESKNNVEVKTKFKEKSIYKIDKYYRKTSKGIGVHKKYIHKYNGDYSDKIRKKGRKDKTNKVLTNLEYDIWDGIPKSKYFSKSWKDKTKCRKQWEINSH